MIIEGIWRDSERNHKHHFRSDTLYPYLLLGKKDIRMTHCWLHKEPSVENDKEPKPQSLHMISIEQHPSELHVTQNGQKINKQIERDLEIRD